MTEYFIQESIKRKGALRRLAKRFHAMNKDGTINRDKLKSHYDRFTLLQKEEFNLYDKVLRRFRQ